MENIEQLVQKTKMTYIDAIMFYCEENKLEPETAGKMVGGKLKQHVQDEAEDVEVVGELTVKFKVTVLSQPFALVVK